tara:strand:- start:1970 stop:2932 length:963 start_codon:yes stop_codon:yes gene_type:complete
MKKKIEIFCTIGPGSLNKKFLKFANSNINLLRLNMSHLNLKQLKKNIFYLKKYSKVPICIDTEGAQIRTKCNKIKYFKKSDNLKIFKDKSFYLYPDDIFNKLKINDKLDIGFSGLCVKIKKKNDIFLSCKVLNSGYFEPNKGVHLINRKIKLNYLTSKDIEAIKIGRKLNIKYYALSFTNSHNDVIRFNKLLKNEKKIFKIETKESIKNLKKIIKFGNNLLIDRGDLSKDIKIENVPIIQRKIIYEAMKNKKNVYVATNFLESMILNSYPTRAEVNDIYNTIEMGARGLVLAAETAIGKNPIECVKILKKIIKVFRKNNA